MILSIVISVIVGGIVFLISYHRTYNKEMRKNSLVQDYHNRIIYAQMENSIELMLQSGMDKEAIVGGLWHVFSQTFPDWKREDYLKMIESYINREATERSERRRNIIDNL